MQHLLLGVPAVVVGHAGLRPPGRHQGARNFLIGTQGPVLRRQRAQPHVQHRIVRDPLLVLLVGPLRQRQGHIDQAVLQVEFRPLPGRPVPRLEPDLPEASLLQAPLHHPGHVKQVPSVFRRAGGRVLLALRPQGKPVSPGAYLPGPDPPVGLHHLSAFLRHKPVQIHRVPVRGPRLRPDVQLRGPLLSPAGSDVGVPVLPAKIRAPDPGPEPEGAENLRPGMPGGKNHQHQQRRRAEGPEPSPAGAGKQGFFFSVFVFSHGSFSCPVLFWFSAVPPAAEKSLPAAPDASLDTPPPRGRREKGGAVRAPRPVTVQIPSRFRRRVPAGLRFPGGRRNSPGQR